MNYFVHSYEDKMGHPDLNTKCGLVKRANRGGLIIGMQLDIKPGLKFFPLELSNPTFKISNQKRL